MQEKDGFCLQCRRPLSAPSNRLVQDSCGHKKCRSCLLDDVENCKQCFGSVILSEQNGEKTDSIPKITDNHTAVIQCNGKARLNCDRILDEVLERKSDPSISTDKKQNINLLDRANESVIRKQVNKEKIKKLREKVGKKKLIDIPSHIILKSDPVSYLCSICNKTFYTKSHVKYHQYCTGDAKPYKCKVCEKEFILKAQLQVHMSKHENVKPFKCSNCPKSFSEKTKLSRHMVLHSPEKKYICPDCAKAFKSKESLRIHCLIHKVEKPFACKLCSAKFNNSSNLRKHLVSHSDEKAHMCDQCGRRFKLKWALSVHRKSHLRVRPHSCDVCFRNFVNFKDLQRHSLVHSESKGFTCGICHTSFRRKDNLHRHMKNTHPGKKGEVIKNDLKVAALPKISVVIDNPNAIKVITASPAITKSIAEAVVAPPQQHTAKSTDSRPTGSVINGPIKLAFKTPAFKSHYNIARDCDYIPPAQTTKSLPLAESVDIAQKILSSSGDNLIVSRSVDERTSNEICQKILSIPSKSPEEPTLKPTVPVPTPPQQNFPSYSSTFHYETSFQYGKHAMIKNIKFKVPEQYTNLFKQNTHSVTDNIGDKGYDHSELNVSSPESKVFSELKPVANKSVIVNNSNLNPSSDIHWRRRTSQNLVLKN